MVTLIFSLARRRSGEFDYNLKLTLLNHGHEIYIYCADVLC